MAVGRDRVDELVEITRRSPRRNRWLAEGHVRILQWLFDRLQQDADAYVDAILPYFVVSLVTAVEVFFRLTIAELIDTGAPYADRAEGLSRNIKFDLDTIRALQGKKFTIGEVIGQSLSLQSLDAVCSAMKTLTEQNFLPELAKVRDRWQVEIFEKPDVPIIADIEPVARHISVLFQKRHIVVHELPRHAPFSRADVSDFLKATGSFLSASNWYVSNLIDPNAPLQQTPMTIAAGQRAQAAQKQLEALISRAVALVRKDRLEKFRAEQSAWEAYRDAAAEFASSIYEGGSAQPMIRNQTWEMLANKRSQDIRELIADLEIDKQSEL